MQAWRGLLPVAVLAVTGCMASKQDILMLQDEIRTLRAMQARSDTMRRAQVDSALIFAQRSQDSVRSLSQRFSAFQATVGGELFEIGKQLITIQELLGVSSKSMLQLRMSLEDRQQASAATDTSKAAQGQAPGPAQLYGASLDLLRRGSSSSARTGFEELLNRYPNFEKASSAQLYIATTYADDKKIAEADSVYRMVVSKYPRSEDAPTALYKLGQSMLSQKKTAEGKALLEQVRRDYPRSIEADLAEGLLKTIK